MALQKIVFWWRKNSSKSKTLSMRLRLSLTTFSDFPHQSLSLNMSSTSENDTGVFLCTQHSWPFDLLTLFDVSYVLPSTFNDLSLFSILLLFSYTPVDITVQKVKNSFVLPSSIKNNIWLCFVPHSRFLGCFGPFTLFRVWCFETTVTKNKRLKQEGLFWLFHFCFGLFWPKFPLKGCFI